MFFCCFQYVCGWPLIRFGLPWMEWKGDRICTNQRPICFQTYTLARRSYSQISSQIGLTRFFVMLFACWIKFFFLHTLLLVVVVILCWFQPNCLIAEGLPFRRSFVLFVLCVRMKVWFHFIALKCLKITWLCVFFLGSYTLHRFKCRDKINASFCIFISSSLSFQVTFKAFYSSLLLENEPSCLGFVSGFFFTKAPNGRTGLFPQDRELFGSV